MKLSEIQQYAKELCEKQGWDKERIQVRMKYLAHEMMEVAEAVYSVSYSEQHEDADVQNYRKQCLGQELFDAIWNIAEIANRFGINLDEAAKEKIAVNKMRNW